MPISPAEQYTKTAQRKQPHRKTAHLKAGQPTMWINLHVPTAAWMQLRSRAALRGLSARQALWEAIQDWIQVPLYLRAELPVTGQPGGRKGGPARASKLTAARRREIAQQAARQRWGNSTPDDTST